jgi:hypothetical protein
MTDVEPVPSFEIQGQDIESAEIEQKVLARSQARRAEAEAEGLDFEAYASGRYPLPANAIFSRELYQALEQVRFSHDKVNVEMDLTETRLPLLGGLVHRLRAGIHELVLFYINRLEARQMIFNEQTGRALAILARDLEAQVRDLRSRLADLEADREKSQG